MVKRVGGKAIHVEIAKPFFETGCFKVVVDENKRSAKRVNSFKLLENA